MFAEIIYGKFLIKHYGELTIVHKLTSSRLHWPRVGLSANCPVTNGTKALFRFTNKSKCL